MTLDFKPQDRMERGDTIWAYLFATIGGYLDWHLVLAWRPGDGD